MYKLVLYLLLLVFFMTMFALQMDEEISMNTLFRVKHGLNRATHAAAQQLDEQKLAQGMMSIDSQVAEEKAYEYLQSNLQLDLNNMPLQGSFLESPVEVLVLDIINENRVFPYHYMNVDYDYEVTLERPGVVMIIRVEYPRIYHVIGPITWIIKGTAELYPII
ncbi:MAG: hypothetical protein WDZ91_14555 [Paenibacillaceae bacterium]